MSLRKEFEKRKLLQENVYNSDIYRVSMENASKLSDITKSGKLSDFLIVLVNYFKYGNGNIQEIRFDKENNKIHIKWKDQKWIDYDPDELWNENF